MARHSSTRDSNEGMLHRRTIANETSTKRCTLIGRPRSQGRSKFSSRSKQPLAELIRSRYPGRRVRTNADVVHDLTRSLPGDGHRLKKRQFLAEIRRAITRQKYEAHVRTTAAAAVVILFSKDQN